MERNSPQNMDYGPEPVVVNIEHRAEHNQNFQTALWTGEHLQVTIMSVRDEVGLEVHYDTDQFIRIVDGHGLVKMGKGPDSLNYQARVDDDYAVFIPAGTWHNILNRGRSPLKLYSVYAPPHHPHGTVHRTRQDAEAAEAAAAEKRAAEIKEVAKTEE